MTEKMIEQLEVMFPQGFVIVFTKGQEDEASKSAHCGMFMHNPDESQALYQVTAAILENFEEE